jgi:hypothetical protein
MRMGSDAVVSAYINELASRRAAISGVPGERRSDRATSSR